MSVIESIMTSKIVVITAIELAEDLLKKIDARRCVDSVLIYSNKDKGISFKKDDFKKVVNVFDNFTHLKVATKNTLIELEKHLEIRRSFDTCKSNKNILYEFGDFLWLHLFVQAAQTTQLGGSETIKQCKKGNLIKIATAYYRGNSYMINEVENFGRNYRREEAIRWYTSLSFPYKLFNKALRTENFDLLMPFLFFINDLKQCLTTADRCLAQEKMTVYRGVNISCEEFEKLKKTKDEFISMNGFLSTSRSRKVAEMFSGDAKGRPGYVAVVFHIECDPFILQNNFNYADISSYSEQPDEEEVLIDIDTTFRVTNVVQDSDDRWIVNMMGSTQFTPVVKSYIENYQFELLLKNKYYENNLSIFISLLMDRYLYESAQLHLEQLLEKPNGEEVAKIYIDIGRAKKLSEEHETLIRKHYDYTRDHLSTRDIKQTARTLNKIGFFLPRAKELHKCSEIPKILNDTEKQTSELTLINNVAAIFPHLGDNFRQSEAMWQGASELATIAQSPGEPHQKLLRQRDQSIADGDYGRATFYDRLAASFSKIQQNKQ